MTTPKNQQKLTPISVSMKKKGPIKGLKHILANPSETVWPILRGETGTDLKNLLTELLPEQKCPEKSVSWTQLRKMSKEERVALKKDCQIKNSTNKSDSVMNNLVLGINAVTRSLEKQKLCSVIVDSNIDPLFMIKHIVTMGQNKNIPVVLVPFLKTETLSKINFSCAAIGLKKTIESDKNSHFRKLYEKILEHAVEFPSKKPIFSFDDTLVNDESLLDEQLPVKSVEKEPFKISKNVYNYRSSQKERVFIPPSESNKNSSLSLQMEEENQSCNDFISIAADIGPEYSDNNSVTSKKNMRYTDFMELNKIKESDHTKTNEFISFEKTKNNDNFISLANNKSDKKKLYESLKVKKIQGNPQRFKATKTPKSAKKTVVKKK